MAPLTWRNVDAPNFANSNDMFRIAAGLMNGGFDAARRGVGDFRDITTQDQSAALMQSIMGAGSPDAITAATQAANPAFLSPEALRFANAQPGILLERENAGLTIDQNNQTIRSNDYNFNRGLVTDQRADAQYEARKNANPVITEAYIAAEAGDWTKANQIFKDNVGLFGEAGIDSLATFQTLTAGRDAGRAEDQAAVAFDNWSKGIENAKTAEDIVTLAGQNFGNMGKSEVIRRIQGLAGNSNFSDDQINEAVQRANSLDIWATTPTNPLSSTAAGLGIPVGSTGARPNNAWANSPVAQTQNPVFNGFMGTVATQVNNPYALAAIQATGEHESGFAADKAVGTWSDPSQSGQQGTSGGILSWREGRLRAMQQVGTTPEAQAQFFLQEDPELIQRLNNAGSVEEAQQLMNNAWKFAGYDKPGGEAAARLATARSLLPAYLNGETPSVGGAGPTRGNAAFMDETGVNPLVSGSNNGVSNLLNAAANGSTRTVDPVTAVNLSASNAANAPVNQATTPTNNSPSTSAAINAEIARAATETATANAVQTNLERAAEVPEPTIALPTPVVEPGATDRATMEALLASATYAPVPEANRVNTRDRAVTEVNPNGTGFEQTVQNMSRNGDINGAVQQIGDAVATGQFGGQGGSPLNNITGVVSDFFTANPTQAAANAESRQVSTEASNWWRSDEAKEFFADHPDQIELAARNPINFAMVAKEQIAENAPAPAPVATNQGNEVPAEQTPLERAVADREATLAAPVAPSVTVSDNTNIPLSTALTTLAAQGLTDQSTNIFGALDRMVANPPTTGTSPREVVNAMMTNDYAGSSITSAQVTNAINKLVTDGVTAPMAAEILRHSGDTADGWPIVGWFGGQEEIDMDAALAIRDAFIGVNPDGSVSTGAATRGQVRMGEVNTALSKVQNLQSQWQSVQDQILAFRGDATKTDDDRVALQETADLIEQQMRKDLLAIEKSGLLSAYSNRQAN